MSQKATQNGINRFFYITLIGLGIFYHSNLIIIFEKINGHNMLNR